MKKRKKKKKQFNTHVKSYKILMSLSENYNQVNNINETIGLR